ncbi:MAG TPA: transcriptional regulator [Cyanobacteria bacterium UBA9971]|nr:transcriptional regulator [Cyanobacteria bacterium UBA9971]
MQENEQKYLYNISQNIKIFREKKGFSQEFLAEQVDCSREFINRVENRKEDVSLKMLLKIAYFLEIQPQKFFDNVI